MAEEKKEQSTGQGESEGAPAETPKAKGSSKMLMIIGAVVGLIVLAGVPVVLISMKKPAGNIAESVAVEIPQNELHPVGHDEAGEPEDLELEEGEAPLGAIVPMDPFVANLRGGRFLRLEVQIAFSEKDVPSRWTTRAPILRDAVVTLLTQKKADDILAQDGVAGLKKDIKAVLNEALKKEIVQDVLVTQIVVQ